MTVLEQARKIRDDMSKVLVKLTDAERAEVISLHRPWAPGEVFVLGEVFRYQNELYRIEQPSYTAAEHQLPGAAGLDALFTKLQTGQVTGEIIEWFEPNATNYYNLGDLVRYTDGKVYESIYNGANVWSPVAYPGGWALRE